MLTLDELKILGNAGLIDKTLMLEYPVATALKGILKTNGCEFDNNGNITAVPDIQILYTKLYNNGLVDLYDFEVGPDESQYQEELTSKIYTFIEDFIDNFNDNSFYKSNYNSNPEQLPSNHFELLLFCYNNSVYQYDRYDSGNIRRLLEVNGTINCMDYGFGSSPSVGLNFIFGGDFTQVTMLTNNDQHTVNNVFIFDLDTFEIVTLVGTTTLTDPVHFVSMADKPIVYSNKSNGYNINKWSGSDWNTLDSTGNGVIYSVSNNGDFILLHREQIASASGLLVYNGTNFQPFTIPEVSSGDNRLINDHQYIDSIIPVIGVYNRVVINFTNPLTSYGLTNYSSTQHNVITLEIDDSVLTAVTVETRIVPTTEKIIYASSDENCVYYTNSSPDISGYGEGLYLCEVFFTGGNDVAYGDPKYIIKDIISDIKFLSKFLIANTDNSEISNYDNYYRHNDGSVYENRMPLKIQAMRTLTETLKENEGIDKYTFPKVDLIGRWLVQNNWND
jgi:hypothetical protein